MISGEDVMLIIRTDIIPKLPSRMFFTSCHGRFVFTTTDGLKNNPHGRFKTSVWGNVRQGILYIVMPISNFSPKPVRAQITPKNGVYFARALFWLKNS